MPSMDQIQSQMQANQQMIMPATPSKETTNSLVNAVKPNSTNQAKDPSHISTQQTKKGFDLIIFVSSSMPPSAIRNYSKQAKSFGAVLMLKGFVNDKESSTRNFVSAMNEGGAQWMIHPSAFTQFKVETVPTIVLADSMKASVLDNGCATDSSYTKLTGDLSLDSALDLISRRAETPYANYAKNLILQNQKQYKPGSILSREF